MMVAAMGYTRSVLGLCGRKSAKIDNRLEGVGIKDLPIQVHNKQDDPNSLNRAY